MEDLVASASQQWAGSGQHKPTECPFATSFLAAAKPRPSEEPVMRIRAIVESGLEYGGVKKLERKPCIAKGTRNGYRESLYDFIAS
ncbi:hypothetical protein IG631_21295 [Alternaria alternata]|nr:hypothetical protein IG631_21295 [Alternaria alternata]